MPEVFLRPNGHPICIDIGLVAHLRRSSFWPLIDKLYAREGRLPWLADDRRTVVRLIRFDLRTETEAKAKKAL